MYCPSCDHRLDESLAQCDWCGFHLDWLDQRFGGQWGEMDQITDATHFLRSQEKERLLDAIDAFEVQFPQFFPAFYIAELPEGTKLPEFALWLLNRVKVTMLDEPRDSEQAFLFVIDLTSRAMTVVPGYRAEPFVSENDLRELLEDASPYIEAGDLRQGLEKMMADLRTILRRNHRLLIKSIKLGVVRPPPRGGSCD